MKGRTLEQLQKNYNSDKNNLKAFGGGMGGRRGPGPGPGGRGMAGGKPKNTGKTVSRLMEYLHGYKLRFVFVFIFMLLYTLTSLAGSYMLRPIINNIAETEYIPEVYIDGKYVKINSLYMEVTVSNSVQETTIDNISSDYDGIGGYKVVAAPGSEVSIPIFVNLHDDAEGIRFTYINKNEEISIQGFSVDDFIDEKKLTSSVKEDKITLIYRNSGTAIPKDGQKIIDLNIQISKKANEGVYVIGFPERSNAEDILFNLLTSLLVLGLVYIVGVITSFVQSKLMITISQGAIERIRNDLFTSLQKLPLKFFDSENNGEIMSRFTNDVDNISTMIDNSLTSVISGIITLVGTLIMMLVTNVWLALITVVFTPLFIFGGIAIASKSRKYYSAQQAALGAVNGYIEESVSGQKAIKVFNHEDTSIQEFSLLNKDLKKKQMFAQFFGGIVGPIMGNLSQISYALTAGIGGVLCVTGGFDVGGLTIFVNYSRQFSMPINQVSQQMTTVFAALAGAERVFNIMDREPEKEDVEDAINMQDMKGYVILNDVSFGYVPGRPVLKNISLYAKPGQKIAFVGSTGAGKTTVTNLLNRFYDIDSGSITIDGVDIQKIKRDTLRKKIAMVLQDTHLFSGTVRENIRYGRPEATDEEVEQAAKTASAHSFIMRLENGYDTLIQGDGSNLSQGQRQLLNIARAAISKAPILVLDEATSSVDTRTERHIEHGMDRLMHDRTTFVIAHRLSTVRNANAIMVLENGCIIERGDHDELLAMKGRYYELYTGLKELD